MYKKGFTLIELLVVIFIIGLLAAIVVVNVNQGRMKTRDAKRVADVNTIRDAVEMYADANKGKYPALGAWAVCPTPTTINSTQAGWSTFAGASGTGLVPTYIANFPVDPVNTASGGAYYYQSCREGANYKVYANILESAEGQAKATSDGGSHNSGATNTFYEVFSPGAQAW